MIQKYSGDLFVVIHLAMIHLAIIHVCIMDHTFVVHAAVIHLAMIDTNITPNRPATIDNHEYTSN